MRCTWYGKRGGRKHQVPSGPLGLWTAGLISCQPGVSFSVAIVFQFLSVNKSHGLDILKSVGVLLWVNGQLVANLWIFCHN